MNIKEAIKLIEQLDKERLLFKKKRIIYFRLFLVSLVLSIISLILFIVFISFAIRQINYQTYMPLSIVFMCVFLISLLIMFTSFLMSRYVYSIKEKYRNEVLKVIEEKLKESKEISDTKEK